MLRVGTAHLTLVEKVHSGQLEDLNAFMTLQEAAIAGLVRQESRDKRNQQLGDKE